MSIEQLCNMLKSDGGGHKAQLWGYKDHEGAAFAFDLLIVYSKE